MAFEIADKNIDFNEIEKYLQSLEFYSILSKKIRNRLLIILEETISNILKYSFDDTENCFINVNVENQKNFLKIRIIDNCMEFNPINYENPEKLIFEDQLRYGGNGIPLIKSYADKLEYNRNYNCNIFDIWLNYKK